MRDAYRVFVRRPEGKTSVDWKILKWMFKKWDGEEWTGLIWLG
jgi:hypothetical protein